LDLVLLDIMMPELDGFQVLQRLKADPILASVPVVVLSARAQEQDLLTALASGAADYVTMPFSFRELLARIDRVLSEGPEPIRMSVTHRSGASVLGELVTGDPKGVSVRFHRDGAPSLVIGDRVTLAMRSASLTETIELEGTVGGRSEAEPYRSFRFALDQRSDREMTDALLRVIGRRGSQRLYFGPEQAVDVRVVAEARGEPLAFEGGIQNISATGMRLLLKGPVDRELHCVDEVGLDFSLPGVETRFQMFASIRHREAADGGVCYGIQFSEQDGEDLLTQQEEIVDYIMSCNGDENAAE
jgi:hypothetical protein